MDKWNKDFMRIAYIFGEHSTCVRKHVGAIIVKDKRIISCGYNGSPKGVAHCSDKFKNIDFRELNTPGTPLNEAHHKFSEAFEVHAEQNCIAFCAKSDISTEGSEIYCTLSPCVNCAKLIAQAGIKKVYYHEKYDRNTEGLDLLESMGIETIQVEL